MASITQDMRYRLSLINYADKYGVTKAAIRYKTNRQYIYRWKRRFDGSIESLRDRSGRPHHHPDQHTPQEIKLISDMRRRNPDAGLVVFWVKLMQRGYSRSRQTHEWSPSTQILNYRFSNFHQFFDKLRWCKAYVISFPS